VEELAVAGKGSIMVGLVKKAGLGGVLNGTMKLDWDGHDWDDGWMERRKRRIGKKGEKVGWTLLCPTDEGFKGLNLTRLLDDEEALGRFVRQHLIPVPAERFSLSSLAATAKPSSFWSFSWIFGQQGGDVEDDPSMPLWVMDDATYSTLLSPSAIHGDVVFRALEGDAERFLVGIKGATTGSGKSEFARVLKWGRSTAIANTNRPPPPTNVTLGHAQVPLTMKHQPVSLAVEPHITLRSGVVLIDRPLLPYVEGWWVSWGQAMLLGMVGSMVIVGGWAVVVHWFKGQESEATYEPIGPGAGGEDDV